MMGIERARGLYIVRAFRTHSFAGIRRGGRVAEGARLERVYTGNRIEGSNPSLSATLEHKCERRSPPILRHLKPPAPAAGCFSIP